MNDASAPLYLVLLDHGGEGTFYTYDGAFDETWYVTPTELASYLELLETGLTEEAQEENIVLLYGACLMMPGASGSPIEGEYTRRLRFPPA